MLRVGGELRLPRVGSDDMRLELSLRTTKPVDPDVIEREVVARLGVHPDPHGEVAGTVGRSARVRLTIPCAGVEAGASPPPVASLQLKLEAEEVRDVQPLVLLCYDLADALRAAVHGPDGAMLDPASATALVLAHVRAKRRWRAALAAVGLSAALAGGVCLHGVEITAAIDGQGTRTVRFFKLGVLGVFLGACLVVSALPSGRGRGRAS